MKKNIFKYLTSLFVLAIFAAACTEQPDVLKSDYDYVPDATKLPTVAITLGEVTGASVECTGAITFVGTDTVVVEKGFICATDQDFKVGVVSASDKTADYHSVVSGLKELTDYYVKAYVITKDGIVYSEALPFSTPMLKNPLAVFVGSYVMGDYKYADESLEAAYNVEFVEIVGNTKQLLLKNFWDGGKDIIVNFDLTAKTVSINNDQVIYVHSSYGDIKAQPYNGTAVATTPLTGTIQEDGTIKFNSWSAQVTAGSFGRYKYSTLVPTTTKIAGTYTEVDYKADGTIEATYAGALVVSPVAGELNKINIKNFWDGGNYTIEAIMNFGANTFTIAPQVIYVHSSYGNCRIYPYNVEAKTVDKSGTPTSGTIVGDTLVVGSWAAIVDAGAFGTYQKSKLYKTPAAAIRASIKPFSGQSAPKGIIEPKRLSLSKVR